MKSCLLIGDSQFKYFQEYLPHDCKVTVNSVSGRKVQDVGEDILALVQSFSHVVVHLGTNNVPCEGPASTVLRMERLLEEIRARNPGCMLYVSSILPRGRSVFCGPQRPSWLIGEFNNRASRLNCLLKVMLSRFARSVFIDNDVNFVADCKVKRELLSRDGLHLAPIGIHTLLGRGLDRIPDISLLKGHEVELGGCSPSGSLRERQPLHQLFSQIANKKGDLPAIILPDEDGDGRELEMSFSEAESASNRLSQALIRCAEPSPNPDGDRVVVVCLPPSADLILTLLAVWKSGSVYLPLEPAAPQHRVRHILSEAKPFLVITSQDEIPLFSELVRTVTVEQLKLDAVSLPACRHPSEAESLACPDPIQIILYTTGSTGLSKGVRMQLSSILNRLHWGWREFPFSRQEEVCVFKTAITFGDSVTELWGSLLAGQPVLVLSKQVAQDPHRLLSLIRKYKIGRLILVPSLLKAILTYLDFSQEKPDSLEHLKLWVCSGETLSVALASEFFKKFEAVGDKILCNFYGSTEVTCDVTAHVMRSLMDVDVSGKVPIGNPVDNTIIYLMDKKLDVVPVGEIGELYVGGRHICAGYVNGRDSYCFVPNPHTVDPDYKYLFRTGDYGRVENGNLLYEGRTDSQIKVRGHRVDLSEVEAALCRLEAVHKGVVLCYHPAQTDQQIIGFVRIKNKFIISSSEIQENLKQMLPSYAIPLIVPVESIPLLESGKVDRQYLLKYFEDQAGGDFTSSDLSGIEPGWEEATRFLFQSVYSTLGPASRGKISSSANFYQIGGNSLNSVLTIAKLKEAGYEIKISDFISAPNLATVAHRMTIGHSENGYHTEEKYTVEFMDEKYKKDVYSIIGDSFGCIQRPDVEQIMDPPVKRSEYDDLMDGLWPTLIRQKLSHTKALSTLIQVFTNEVAKGVFTLELRAENNDVTNNQANPRSHRSSNIYTFTGNFVLKNEEGDVMGCSLSMDISDKPQLNLTGQLSYVFQFLDYLEKPLIENMLPQGKILHSFMLGTNRRLSPQENIEVTEVIERAIEKIGRSKSFIGIFATNTSPLTQQLANILNYKQLKSYQINEFVATDGTRPFERGPDSLIAVSAYKQLN